MTNKRLLLFVRELTEQMQGFNLNIRHGPIPFCFADKTVYLRGRYYIARVLSNFIEFRREITKRQKEGTNLQ